MDARSARRQDHRTRRIGRYTSDRHETTGPRVSMRVAQPDELTEHALPVLTARLSEAELRKWFPVSFQEITDPAATPEPSKGALIQLDAGQFAVIYYGEVS